jgi:flagella basal body P-ring formation protein FlgA
MTMRSLRALRVALALAALAGVMSAPVRVAAVAPGLSPAGAIREAVIARVGSDASVTIKSIDTDRADLSVREARPDPSARLGQPIRFTLITGAGPGILVTADIEVVVTHAVVKSEIARGHAVDAASIEEIKGVLTDVPLGRVVTRAEALGTRALRPIAPGTVLTPVHLALRRVVEPGDTVVVTALVGTVEVSATFIAVDGGAIGDAIRVRNPQTRKYIRGRILKAGAVEVIHER